VVGRVAGGKTLGRIGRAFGVQKRGRKWRKKWVAEVCRAEQSCEKNNKKKSNNNNNNNAEPCF